LCAVLPSEVQRTILPRRRAEPRGAARPKVARVARKDCVLLRSPVVVAGVEVVALVGELGRLVEDVSDIVLIAMLLGFIS